MRFETRWLGAFRALAHPTLAVSLFYFALNLVRGEEDNNGRPCRLGTCRREIPRPRRGIHRHFWPAPGSADTELGVFMEPEVSHGETEVYPRVQA